MEHVAPRSSIPSRWQGNPLSMRAGIALLEVLEQPGVYDKLDQLGQQLEEGLLIKNITLKQQLIESRVL